MKGFKKTFAALLVCALVFGTALSVRAAGSVTLVFGEQQEFEFADGSELFRMDPVVPGDEYRHTVTLRNSHSGPVRLFLSVRPADDQPISIAFTDALRLQVDRSIGGQSATIYLGSLSGKVNSLFAENLSAPVSLGVLESGADCRLRLTVSVPTSLGSEYMTVASNLIWTFTAEDASTPPDPDPDPDPDPVTPVSPIPNRPGPSGRDRTGSDVRDNVRSPSGTTITDNPVPLADLPIIDDWIDEIFAPDDAVPLAELPKTGGGPE